MSPQTSFRLLALALLLSLAGAPPREAAAQGTTTQRTCGRSAFTTAAGAGTTQLVPVTNDRYAGNEIFICGYTAVATAAGTVQFVYGTGTNCATGTVNLTPAFSLAINGVLSDTSPIFRGLDVPAGQNLCVTVGAAFTVIVYFDNNPL
jgi:hypothetical protein